MAGRSEFSVLDLRRKSGHVAVALSCSSASPRCCCPLSIASRSTDDALVDALDDAGDAAPPCTAFMVTSRADTHIFLSESCAALSEALAAVEPSALPLDMAASGEALSRLWRAAPAVVVIAAGRLLPHCSHALLLPLLLMLVRSFVPVCFMDVSDALPS